MEANLVLGEVLNSVTHGVGIILCLIGTSMLTDRASGASDVVRSSCYLYAQRLK
jgi:predicted membrane channel-forming protein YqfA (hemolysin III family)